jgi:hypothetical protein
LIKRGKDIKAATKEYANRVLNIYHCDYEAVLKNNNALLNRIHSLIHGINFRPIGAWMAFVEEITLKNNKHLYLWREPLLTVYLALQTKQADDGRIEWREDFAVNFPIFDAILLIRLIPIVEEKTKIDTSKFNSWYQQWPKGSQADYNNLITFLAQHQAAYWKKQLIKNPNNPPTQVKAAKTAADWRNDPNWVSQLNQPIELLRIIRNSTVPHDESIDGAAIKDGGHLFVNYFGKANHSKATEFIRKAQEFII